MRAPVSYLIGFVLISTLSLPLATCASGTPPPGPKCGNGDIDPGETCDGSNLNGQDCDSLGHGAGTLSCNSSCGFDTSGCGPSTCGNLVIDLGEECDSLNLNGASCLSLGFGGGALVCGEDCQWDTSACVTLGCGNGVIESGEECDDGNTTAEDGCSPSCTIEPGWSCAGQPSECNNQCGNNAVNASEECDGDNLDGNTCYTLGFTGGTLDCTANCRYDLTQCEGDPCGNASIDTGEDCDGANLDGKDCTTVPGSFTGGTLGCTAGCTFDTSGCTSNQCGNNTQETGEECDGGDLGGATCQTLGYAGGTLGCQGDCTYDETGCTVSADCGNGAVEGSEQCDDGNTASGDGCSAGCQWESTCSVDDAISCGGQVTSNLLLEGNSVDFYSCGTEDATTGDKVYSFVAPSSGVATATLQGDSGGLLPNNVDLYVLQGACNPTLCTASGESLSDDTVQFNVVQGREYVLVVELNFVGIFPTGAFTLSLTCP